MSHPHPVTLVQKLAARAAKTAAEPPALLRSIPVDNYTSALRFEHEINQLFLNRPLIIGHESQIPNVGDTLTYDWLGAPLVTTRDKEGNIATFYNVCRHRGMRLLQDEGKSCQRSLVCPYHHWTYGLNGELRNIPRQEMFAGVDASQLGLKSVNTAIRGGLIWIQLHGEFNLDEHLAGLEKDLSVFEVDEYQFSAQSVRKVACNWKLVQDAFLDGYHVTRLHKNTVGSFFPDAMAESDDIGCHIRSAVARNEIFDVAENPSAEIQLRHPVTFSYTVFPNAVIVFHPEYTSILSLFPTKVDESIFVHTMLTPTLPESDAQRDHFQRSFKLIDEGVFGAEDIFVSVGAQRGMNSGVNENLLFGGLEEAAVRFHDTLERELKSIAH